MGAKPCVLTAFVLVTLSCTPDAPEQPVPASSAAAAGGQRALATPGARAAIPDEELLSPLTRLGSCDPAPSGQDSDVAGLVLPEDAIVTNVADADPLTNVQGYIPATPVQIRVFYQQHPELEVLSVEDEGFEAEVLTETEGYRVFVKAQAVCELGSVFVAIVSPAASR